MKLSAALEEKEKSKLNEYRESLLNDEQTAVKFDADSQSELSFNTDASSYLRNPSTINTVASSRLELQLNFLAKELEMERDRREKLQSEVKTMAQKL